MPRPRKCRRICSMPRYTEFSPDSSFDEKEETVTLTVDEYEALRLIDLLGYSQEQCGEYMQVARTTVQQIYASARKKTAEMLVNGRRLSINGGDFCLCRGGESFIGCLGCRRHIAKNSVQINRGKENMKIAVPLDADKKNICVSFGRAPIFLVYDLTSGEKEYYENPAANAEGGAGIKAAQAVTDFGVSSLITVRCGENAAQVFNAAGIKIYKAKALDADGAVREFKAGQLDELTHFHTGYHGIR